MKTKLFLFMLVALICTACSSGSLKEKGEKLLENIQNEEGPSQKQYSEALSILNETYATQSRMVDKAMQAVENGDNEKAQEILNKIRDDEDSSQNSQLINMLETADLDDANKAAFEDYKQKAQSLSDKITEVVTSLIDLE